MATAATFRNLTETITVKLVTETCCNCGVVFAMPEEFNKNRRRTGDSFYCPAGHSQAYVESEEARKRREAEEKLAQSERSLEAWTKYANDTQDKLTTERKSHASTKGQLTKTRNRIHAGVCPDCNRHFENVERHMASKHKGGA